MDNYDFLKKLAPKDQSEMEEILRKYPIRSIKNVDGSVVDEPVEVIKKVSLLRRPLTFVASLTVVVGIAAVGFFGIRQTNEEMPGTQLALSRFDAVFADFNSSHGTDYGFLTDEMLDSYGFAKDKYWDDMNDLFAGMSDESFREFLESEHEKYMADYKFEFNEPSPDLSSDEPLEYEKNIYGKTYGGDVEGISYLPDLVRTMGDNQRIGYIKAIDLMDHDPTDPEDALRRQEENDPPKTAFLFDSSGEKIIDTFTISSK